MKYKIIRHYFDGENVETLRGLTLEQAQDHCKDPETSSSTAKFGEPGKWFDGYEKE